MNVSEFNQAMCKPWNNNCEPLVYSKKKKKSYSDFDSTPFASFMLFICLTSFMQKLSIRQTHG
jgi:hypothetical protein